MFLKGYIRNLLDNLGKWGGGANVYSPQPNAYFPLYILLFHSSLSLRTASLPLQKRPSGLSFALHTAQDRALNISSHLHCQGQRTLIRLLDSPTYPPINKVSNLGGCFRSPSLTLISWVHVFPHVHYSVGDLMQPHSSWIYCPNTDSQISTSSLDSLPVLQTCALQLPWQQLLLNVKQTSKT